MGTKSFFDAAKLGISIAWGSSWNCIIVSSFSTVSFRFRSGEVEMDLLCPSLPVTFRLFVMLLFVDILEMFATSVRWVNLSKLANFWVCQFCIFKGYCPCPCALPEKIKKPTWWWTGRKKTQQVRKRATLRPRSNPKNTTTVWEGHEVLRYHVKVASSLWLKKPSSQTRYVHSTETRFLPAADTKKLYHKNDTGDKTKIKNQSQLKRRKRTKKRTSTNRTNLTSKTERNKD